MRRRPNRLATAAIELALPLRYTGTRLGQGQSRAPRRPVRDLRWPPGRSSKRLAFQGFTMSSTFDTVVNIIAETCDIPRENIKPESHATNDLGIDSLDFLDVAFAIDKTFGIKMPIEQWTQEVNEGRATSEQYFVLQNLCERID